MLHVKFMEIIYKRMETLEGFHICTLTLKEYRTVCSIVVMLVWRILSCKSSRAAMVLISCPGLLLDNILINASNPKSFTSTSAKHDLLSAVSSCSPVSNSTSFIWSLERGMPGKNGGWGCWIGTDDDESPIGLGPSPYSLLLFCDSRHWRSCSNSLTNSIAPPIIDAWSPY